MKRWKGRLKRILALTLACSLIGSGTNNLVSSAATGTAGVEESVTADGETADNEVPVSLSDVAVPLDEEESALADGVISGENGSEETGEDRTSGKGDAQGEVEEKAPEAETDDGAQDAADGDGELQAEDSDTAAEEDAADSETTDGEAPEAGDSDSEHTGGVTGEEEAADSETTDGEASEAEDTDSEHAGGVTGEENAADSETTDGGAFEAGDSDSEHTGGVTGEEEAADSETTDGGAFEAEDPDGEHTGGVTGEEEAADSETTDGEAFEAEDPDEDTGAGAGDDVSDSGEAQETEDADQTGEDGINAEPDENVEAVKALVSALPSPEDIRAQSEEEREESYRQVCDAHAAYNILTAEQKARIHGAEETFALLFACYEEIAQEPIVQEIDLSDWIFQEGGHAAWPDESVEMWSLDGVTRAGDLDGAGKAVLAAARNWESQVDISGYNITKNEIDGFLVNLFNYNPDFFYVKLGQGGCSYWYSSDEIVQKIDLKYNDYTPADVQTYQNALEKAYAEAITSDRMTEVQKARALHDYLAQHMQYDETYSKYNAYNALVEGTAVCQGYTLAYAALLAKAGIGVDYCIGAKEMDHIWNYVELDGAWYHVDVTWDDPLKDKVGYAGYKYFLCSDAQMGSEGQGGKNVHYGWESRQSCNSTLYDNAYWKYGWSKTADALSAIFFVNGEEYYLRRTDNNTMLSVIKRSQDTETAVCQVPAEWRTQEGTWPGLHSSLSYYNGILYFNNQNTIYALRPGRDTAMPIYTYSGANALYGSFVCNDRLILEIADNPNRNTVERKTENLPAVPEIPVGTISNKEQGGYRTDYVYNGTTVPAPTENAFETTNTGAAMTFEWYRNSVAAGNKLASEPEEAGSYILRVRAAMTNDYDAAMLDLNVTIAKAAVTVTVTAQDKIYDGTVAAVVDVSLTGVVSGDDVKLAKPTATFADQNAGTGKRVILAGGSLTGTDAANYNMNMPSEVSADISARNIAVIADDKEKIYGDAEPALTYTVSASTPLVAGEKLTGTLVREEGEDVKEGGYQIKQGSLTATNNPNYAISFQEGKFTIKPAQYTVTVNAFQGVVEGIGTFVEPVFRVGSSTVPGSVSYTYDGTNYTYRDLVNVLKNLGLGEKGNIAYSFAPANGNYTGTGTGNIAFEIRDVEFFVGTETANGNNAVTVQASSVYGDTWEQIVQIGNITAKAGTQTDSDKSHYRLSVSGMPYAGEGQEFRVLYNGTLNGKIYRDVEVCKGTVDVDKRTITVTAGSYRVSRVYDGTTAPGQASGALALDNVLSQDSGKVAVTTQPVEYKDPNVGGQEKMTVALTLSGEAAGNYKLGSAAVDVPCAITPKPIEPVLRITGSYSYTGQNIMPKFTVTWETDDGTEMVLGEEDCIAVVTDNLNAGTGRVAVMPREGSNYTWAKALEGTFTIAKVDYPYEKTAELSARYGNSVTFDLAALLPQGFVLGEISVTDSDGILQGAPTVDGSVLGYQVSGDREKIGKTASFTVPVTASTNYNPFELTLVLTVSDKLEQTEFCFSQKVLDKVYGDGDFQASVVNAAAGSTLSFTSSNPNVAAVDENGKVQIYNAGSTVITAWASETGDYLRGTATCTLNVAPKALTWDVSGLYAVDREGNVTEQKKASLYGELKADGILPADADRVSFRCPAEALKGTYEAAEPGERRVFLGWADSNKPAVLQGEAASNYTLPDALPELKGKINAVKNDLPVPAESTSQVQYSLSMESGISQVPPALKNIESLNTPGKIETAMKLNIQERTEGILQENIAVYDITLMVNVDGLGWQTAGKDNFPAQGLTITLPYPEGTGKDTHDFAVCHLFTEDGNGHKAGEAEYPEVTKTEAGIRFKVNGLSPISVGWTKAGALNNAVEEKPGAPSSGGQQNTGSRPDEQGAVLQSPKTGEDDSALWCLISMAVVGGILAGMAFRRSRKNGIR